MCGISGILYNFKAANKTLNFDKYKKLTNNLSSISLTVQSIKDFTKFLNEAEPLVDELIDFQHFYNIYIKQTNTDYIEKLLFKINKTEKELNEYLKTLEVTVSADIIEQINSIIIRFRDLSWKIKEDIIGNIIKIKELNEVIKLEENKKIIYELWKLNFILNNLDRLEVRGRDSAGISCIVNFESLLEINNFKELLQERLKNDYEQRLRLEDFINKTIIETSSLENKKPSLIFTFKVAEEIGKMGDNVEKLRKFIKEDSIFLKALSYEKSFTNFFAHTRWASNGIINEQNCHPVNNQNCSDNNFNKPFYISAVLNGDIDNYQELKEQYTTLTGNNISDNITTDTKIIPLIIEKYYKETKDMKEAFRLSLNEFKGSMAIAVHSTLEPEKVYLALRGSGQAIFIGLIKNGYVFASELYGIVEGSSKFIKLDGEKERIPGDLSTQGQIFVLSQDTSGGLEHIKAFYFDGVSIELNEELVKKAEITTRDINRGKYTHFLLKEISESPISVEKTFRGKFALRKDNIIFNLNKEIIPEIVINKLKKGDIKKIYLIGQGTASIAGNGIANFMARLLAPSNIQIISTKSTELSGFLLETDMSNSLAIAVSQSGTTTDTNRTVDLIKSRGAYVIAIVNRRNSDLVYKSDGVFYTSDGRDIEMSVASTKAFYSQIVAGIIISLYFAQLLSTLPNEEILSELKELISLPEKMYTILSQKDKVREVAEEFAVTRKHWAVVGSGPNKVAGDEIRIKLSELCYKSIASDTTEDKKHIDLSSEPLIIICVSGVKGSNLSDIVKEVAIFKAHKACPIVIATEGQEDLFKPYAAGLLLTPHSSEGASVLLNTMIGHLWGYYAAKAIDESANLIKSIRAITVETLVKFSHGNLYEDRNIIKNLSHKLYPLTKKFYSLLKKGRYNSCLEVNTASQLSLLLKYLQGKISMDDFEADFEKIGTLNNVLNEAIKFLSTAIADLTRPIDAIKHQAKTVTVGISRLEEIPTGILFEKLKEENISLNSINYQNTFILQAISPAIEYITGSTRYEVVDLDPLGYPADNSKIITLSKTGIASSMSSRADKGTLLIGRKKSVIAKNKVFAGKGSSDEKSIVILPIAEKGICHYLLLFHVEFREKLDIESKINLLRALDKYDDIKYIVTEMNITWEDSLLEEVSAIDLIGEDPNHIAEWIACS